jgi:UDP:flavonoid glycosyltransferase YjiC (YdhE family)
MRIAVITGPAPGHAFPAAALAVGLRRAGHDVCVLSGPEWSAALKRDDVESLDLPLLSHDYDHGDIGHRLYVRAAEMAGPCAEILRRWRADAVVSDTLVTCGAWAAALCGLPWVELIPHPLQDLSRDLPPPGTGLPRGRTPLGRGRDAFLRRMTQRSLALAAGQRADARRSIGLRDEPPPRVRLVATVPALEPSRSDWPARTSVVGPLVWDPADVDLAPPPGDHPLVFVSASTVPGRTLGLLETALEGLRDVRVVCTTLSAYDKPLPSWARVGVGRQQPLLDAASVMVSGAGNGIVCKGLTAGLPMVLVPGWGEQKENAARASRLGASITIRPGKLTAERLRRAVADVIDNRNYAAASRAAGCTASQLGADHAAATVINALNDESAAR